MIRATLVVCLLAASYAPLSAEDNVLTNEERENGWVLLFDGQSTTGWMSIQAEPLAETHVQNGALNPHPCNYMLVHEKPWGDCVLTLDFKISPGCNSGVFFRTWPLEPRPGYDVGFNGLEIAVDDTTTAGFHDTGAIYDLVPASENAMKPAGEWNTLRLTCDDNLIKVEVNGIQTAAMDLDQWTEAGKRADGTAHKFSFIAYKEHPRKGYIGLQDHGADCWYRNIKLKPLNPVNNGDARSPQP